MKPDKIPLFNFILRLIGVLFVIPSILGICTTIGLFFYANYFYLELASRIEGLGLAGLIGSGISYGVIIFIGIVSVASGLIGWLLLLKRKVYKCAQCGFFINRA